MNDNNEQKLEKKEKEDRSIPENGEEDGQQNEGEFTGQAGFKSDTSYEQADVWIHFSNPFSTGFWLGLGLFAAGFFILLAFSLIFGGLIGGSLMNGSSAALLGS